MKKKISAILLILTVIINVLGNGFLLRTEAAVSGDWEYVINDDDGTATVTKYSGDDMVVSIPSQLNGKSVTGIQGNYNSGVFNSNIISVTIPKSVKRIGEYSFYNCGKLSSVTIPSNVEAIEAYTFYGCTSLTSIKLPSKLIAIDKYAFALCTSLASVTIPSNVVILGVGAFRRCSSLMSITIPGKVVSIDDYAFGGCENLKAVNIKNGTLRLGSNVFGTDGWWNYTNVTTAVIPESVQFMAEDAFGSNTDFTMYGIEGSYARTYADSNDIAFIPISSSYTFNVSFNMNGASVKAPETQKITPGFKIKRPAAPKRSGYVFGGWYREKSCQTLWDFTDDTVRGKMTLYARWVKPPAVPSSLKANRSYAGPYVELSWRVSAAADGYEIIKASSSNRKYEKLTAFERNQNGELIKIVETEENNYQALSLFSVGNSGNTTYAYYSDPLPYDFDIDQKPIYYYRVRAYIIADGKKLYSDYTKTASRKF